MAFDSQGKSAIIESAPHGLDEAEPLGSVMERKLTAEDNKSKSAKTHATEPVLKASSSK